MVGEMSVAYANYVDRHKNHGRIMTDVNDLLSEVVSNNTKQYEQLSLNNGIYNKDNWWKTCK